LAVAVQAVLERQRRLTATTQFLDQSPALVVVEAHSALLELLEVLAAAVLVKAMRRGRSPVDLGQQIKDELADQVIQAPIQPQGKPVVAEAAPTRRVPTAFLALVALVVTVCHLP